MSGPARRARPSMTPFEALLTVVVVFALWMATRHTYITLTVLSLAAVGGTTLGIVRFKRRLAIRNGALRSLGTFNPHRMNPTQFEEFLAALCRRDGCHNVRVVGGAGDLAADVLYTDPHGRPGLIQAKRYQRGNSVGSEHVQMVNGTYRDAHHCQHAAIVTTSSFTRSAAEFAHKVGITLVEDHRLTAWINGQRTAAPWN
jgi:restriction system protein